MEYHVATAQSCNGRKYWQIGFTEKFDGENIDE